MKKFISDGETDYKNCIDELKESDIVIFLIPPYYGSSYYGSSIEPCSFKEECKAESPMKTGQGRMSLNSRRIH